MFVRYIKIYETALIPDYLSKTTIDGVTFRIVTGGSMYEVFPVRYYVCPSNTDAEFSVKPETVRLSANSKYLIFTTDIDENETAAELKCEELINSVIARLSFSLKPQLFSNLIIRGWLYRADSFSIDLMLLRTPTVLVNDTHRHLNSLQLNTSVIDMNKYKCYCYWYEKGITINPFLEEEKFIYFFTCLEVFPMVNTTNIYPVIDKMTLITGCDFDDLKNKLYGKLYGIRCDIVHNGKLLTDLRNGIDYIQILENTTTELLRFMFDEPYARSLDRFL